MSLRSKLTQILNNINNSKNIIYSAISNIGVSDVVANDTYSNYVSAVTEKCEPYSIFKGTLKGYTSDQVDDSFVLTTFNTSAASDYILSKDYTFNESTGEYIKILPKGIKGIRLHHGFDTVDLFNLNTSNYDNLTYLFYRQEYDSTYNKSIKLINLSTIDVSNITNITGLCNCCLNLETVIFDSNWNNNSITVMYAPFESCMQLKELDLSDINTSKCQDFRYLFDYCSNLVTVNLANWDFNSALENKLGRITRGATKLTTITGPVYNIKQNIDLHDAPLNAESVNVILKGLAEVTDTRTLTLNSYSYLDADIDSEPTNVVEAINKGWTIVEA